MRKCILEKPPSTRFTYDTPVEEFVERAAEGRFAPSTYVAKRIVREPRSDARGNLSSGAAFLGELRDTSGDERLQVCMWSDLCTLAKIVDELRQEERVAVGNGEEIRGHQIGELAEGFGKLAQVVERQGSQRQAPRAGCCASLASQPMEWMWPRRFVIAIGYDDHDGHA